MLESMLLPRHTPAELLPVSPTHQSAEYPRKFRHNFKFDRSPSGTLSSTTATEPMPTGLLEVEAGQEEASTLSLM